MKKFIFAIAVFCAAAVCLTACNKSSGDGQSDAEYGSLNSMLALNYSQIDVTVTNTFSQELSLVSEYSIKYSDGGATVSYKIERFAEISFGSPVSDVKTTVTGETDLNDGENVGEIAEIKLDFKKEYFANADFTAICLKADVIDASGFIGSEIDCTEMRVEATFLEIFYDLKITYSSGNGTSTELFYVFTL